MAGGHIEEIAEADAPPPIDAIYAEIRRTTAAPMTALIWRHLATMPGVLSGIWAVLGPLYRGGYLQEAAWGIAGIATQAAPASAVTPDTLRAAGLDDAAIAGYGRVLAAYNRVNPVNFVAARVLSHRLGAGDRPGGPPLPTRAWQPPATLAPMPPMAPVSAMSATQRRQVDALNADPRLDRTGVVPSLYRHLVGWPALLTLIHDDLGPRCASGEIGRHVARVAAALDTEAARLATSLDPIPGLAGHAGVTQTLSRFSLMIPEMVLLGRLMQRGLEGEA